MSTAIKNVRRNATLLHRDAAGARRATFRLCTPAVARDGMVLLPEGIDLTAHKLAGSPFVWCHDTSDPDNAIGKVVEYKQSPEALDIVVDFDDDGPQGLASRCWAKVQADLIRSVSIFAAAIATETRQIGGRAVLVVTRSELQEASLVIVGSDRGAVRLDRAAVLRALDTLTKEPKSMDKAELAKTLGIGEDADREAAEAAVMKYLAGDDEGKQAIVKALDECYPEPAPAAGEPAERAADAEKGKDEEVEALRAANTELTRALAAAQAAQAAAPKAEQVAAEAVKREAKIAADVDAWIAEGRVQRAARAEYLEKHRNGKAAAIVRNIPAGAWTTGQRLAGGAVGTEVTDLPAKPETALRRDAKSLVAQARSMDRSGYVVGTAPAAQQNDSAVKSEAKRLIEQARGLRG